MQKDSTLGTLLVAFVVCVFCSLLVSGAAVALKEKQDINKALDIKKNLLLAANLITKESATPANIEAAFKEVQGAVIELSTGEITDQFDAATFDQRKAAKDASLNKIIESSKDYAGIKKRAQYATVYQAIKDGKTDMYIFPVSGKGLWSTLYGFLVLGPDLQTVRGVGFYEHAETPGLGGEVDNVEWKNSWKNKKIFNDKNMPALTVVKGRVLENDKMKDYKIDGLSGATITSNGVSGLIKYWMGHDGFGPYIEKQKAMQTSTMGAK